jgi:O-antigen ligase
MGTAAPTNDDFRRVSKRVELKLNHLHNNPLQVLLETGWLGLTAWLIWIATVFRLMLRNLTAAGQAAWPRAAALAILGSFLGLMLNGLVEYNFGDSEILMLLCLLMGAAEALRCRGPIAFGAA